MEQEFGIGGRKGATLLEQNRSEPHFPDRKSDLKILWRTPFLKGALVVLLLIIGVAGLLMEIKWFGAVRPPGFEHLRNDLSIILFSFLALFSVSLSGAVLYNGWRKSQWNGEDAMVFYGGMLLGIIFLLAGFQFFLFGELRCNNPVIFYGMKSLNVVLLLLFLTGALRYEWKERRKERRE